jgi:general secretion pathway protein A
MPGVVEVAEPPDHPYLGRFQFIEAPFLPAPDRRFVYRSESFGRVHDAIIHGLDRGHPLLVAVGATGVGKTTLCLELSASVPEGDPVSVILDPSIGGGGIFEQARSDFSRAGVRPGSLPSDGSIWQEVLDALARRHKRAILVVDDAHELDGAALESLLALQDTGESSPRLQLVLVGQPRLEDLLRESQRASRRALFPEHLAPLAAREVKSYVERRLWIAQGGIAAFSGPVGDLNLARFPRRTVWGPRFSAGATTLIAAASKGNPRTVNAICDRVLARASGRSSNGVNERLVQAVARDLGLVDSARAPAAIRPRWIAIAAAILITAGALVAFVSIPRRSAAVAGEPSSPPSAPAADDPKIDRRSFQTVRKTALERAAALATVPDVKGLLKVRDTVLQWEQDTSYENPNAVKDLLTEVERLTNEARARRLALDREQFLKEAGKSSAR